MVYYTKIYYNMTSSLGAFDAFPHEIIAQITNQLGNTVMDLFATSKSFRAVAHLVTSADMFIPDRRMRYKVHPNRIVRLFANLTHMRIEYEGNDSMTILYDAMRSLLPNIPHITIIGCCIPQMQNYRTLERIKTLTLGGVNDIRTIMNHLPSMSSLEHLTLHNSGQFCPASAFASLRVNTLTITANRYGWPINIINAAKRGHFQYVKQFRHNRNELFTRNMQKICPRMEIITI